MLADVDVGLRLESIRTGGNRVIHIDIGKPLAWRYDSSSIHENQSLSQPAQPRLSLTYPNLLLDIHTAVYGHPGASGKV